MALVTVVASANPPSYTSKFDSIDIERVLNNSRILTQYINCLLDVGSCTSEGRELKSKIQVLKVILVVYVCFGVI